MSLTTASPPPRASTNRLADVFQKLEQSQPLAVRLAGNSTAGQADFSDDPRSTWGFNLLGCLQKPRSPKLYVSFSTCTVWSATQTIECKHLNVLGWTLREAESYNFATCLYDKTTPGTPLNLSEATPTSCVMWVSGVLWGPQSAQVSVVPAISASVEPPLQAEIPAHLEPATFGWTKSGFKARAAAQEFSEKVHGDY